ncbi:MAG: Gfo/Idh/MocA family oxidoreductase [Pirellulaceae bacterium]
MSKPLRWGILGTGNIAAKFAAQLNATDHGQLVATGSRTLANADAFAGQHGGQGHGSYEQLVADPQVEAIYNSLPNSLHASWSIAGMQAGKHVLCEKPLAATTAEIEQMFATADATGMKLMEAFMYRQHPVVKQVLQELQDGMIGKIKIIRSHFTYQRPDSAADIRYQPALGGGGLLDVGCYCLNFMRAIAGCEPHDMQAQAHLHETGVDDYAVGILNFPNDILGIFSCGMTVQADRTTTVAGSDGYLQINAPWFSDGSYQVIRGEETEQRQVGQSELLYALEAEHFGQVIREQATPLISLQDSLGNARVLETLQQQIQAAS